MLGAVLIWGGSFIATKAAVLDVPPIGFAVVRFILATLVLLAAHVMTRTPLRLPRAYWGRVAIAGLLGVTLTYGLENVALKFTTAGNGALFIAASPLLTIAGAVLVLRERLTVRLGLGALLAFVGMALLLGAHVDRTGLGDALMALDALVGVVYSLVSKKLAEDLSPLTTLTYSFAVGTLGLLPLAGAEACWLPAGWHVTPTVVGAWLFLGVLASCVAYWLWMYALGRLSASRVGIYLYLLPVVTLSLSAWWLHEPMGPVRALQASMVLGGVYLASSTSLGRPKEAFPT